MKKPIFAALLLALLLPAGCGQAAPSQVPEEEDPYVEEVSLQEVDMEDEAVALAAAPAMDTMLVPAASGTLVKANDKAQIDYSNTADGYVMVRYTAATTKRLKVQVKGPATTYTYNLPAGEDWTTFPLSDGNGSYQTIVYENVTGSKYSTVLSQSFTVTLKDEFAPFLRPNQYVNYTEDSTAVAKGAELTAGIEDNLEKVAAIYDYVVKNLTYDRKKAQTVKSGYLPDIDKVLEEKKGICFDYAALMAAMLRSQEVPVKLVVGYTGKVYHAWLNVWSEESGWVDGMIFFDGADWKLMDPTFASSGKQSESIMKYINNPKNYSAKYLY